MLHWLHIFGYLGLCCLISLIFLNKNLFSLLLVSEVMLLILFAASLSLAGFYNAHFLISASLFVLMFGGLELALNFLLLTIN